MIGCDLIRDLEMYKIPEDYFSELDKKYGIVRINPDDLTNKKLKDNIYNYYLRLSKNKINKVIFLNDFEILFLISLLILKVTTCVFIIYSF